MRLRSARELPERPIRFYGDQNRKQLEKLGRWAVWWERCWKCGVVPFMSRYGHLENGTSSLQRDVKWQLATLYNAWGNPPPIQLSSFQSNKPDQHWDARNCGLSPWRGCEPVAGRCRQLNRDSPTKACWMWVPKKFNLVRSPALFVETLYRLLDRSRYS